MARGDNRRTMKMQRLKNRRKKKARLKKQTEARKKK